MKIGFATVITLFVTLGTWLVTAFHTNLTKSAKKTSTFYRSLSGLLSSSSQALSSLAPSIATRCRDLNMISSHHVYTEPKASFWPFTYFSSSAKSPTLRELKQADEIMRSYKASAEAASSSQQNNMKSVHVAGFMDYDPKSAAKNAYRSASIRRDNSWFHL